MEKKLEDILDICIERIRQGASIDDCLKDYPKLQDELKELLQLAKGIQNLPKPQPAREKIDSCLVRLGEVISSRKTSIFDKLYLPIPRLAKAFALAIFLIFISWGVANISAESLPGSPFYPIKLFTEKVKYFLTITPEAKVELRIIFSGERLKELTKTVEENKELDRSVLLTMLNEATLALNSIHTLAETKRPIYISRLKHLSAYQKDVLEGLRSKVPQGQKKDLENAIQMCEQRMQHMMEMKRHHMPMMMPKRNCGM